jgi:hypothetical protein
MLLVSITAQAPRPVLFVLVKEKGEDTCPSMTNPQVAVDGEPYWIAVLVILTVVWLLAAEYPAVAMH